MYIEKNREKESEKDGEVRKRVRWNKDREKWREFDIFKKKSKEREKKVQKYENEK